MLKYQRDVIIVVLFDIFQRPEQLRAVGILQIYRPVRVERAPFYKGEVPVCYQLVDVKGVLVEILAALAL